MTDRARIFESACEELRTTVTNQQTAYHKINQRAVDLAKIDLLAMSVVLTGVSVSSLDASLPLAGGLSSFLYALWCCTRVYEPRPFARGLAAGTVDEIDFQVRKGLPVAEHYRNVMYSYKRGIDAFSETHDQVKDIFRNALWSSVAAITFFAVVVVRRVLPVYPNAYDFVWLVLIPVLTVWVKDKYEADRSTTHG